MVHVAMLEMPCCRSLAVKRRNALLLYEYSRNAAGLPMPGTQRHFKLSANPRQIGQESVGLGVYLTSVIMYMGILLVLALLMIYLTVDNSQQNGYTQTYTSFVNNVSWPVDGHPKHTVVHCIKYCAYIQALMPALWRLYVPQYACLNTDVVNTIHLSAPRKQLCLHVCCCSHLLFSTCHPHCCALGNVFDLLHCSPVVYRVVVIFGCRHCTVCISLHNCSPGHSGDARARLFSRSKLLAW